MARQESYNFSVIRYNTFNGFDVTTIVDNVALDLTDAHILIQFRQSISSPVLLQFTELSGITISSTVTGKWTLDECVIDLPAGQYVYDVQITLNSGRIKTYQRGCMTVTEAISHG